MTLNTHTANVFLPGCLGPVRREVVLAEDAQSELAALREELATLRDQHVEQSCIFCNNSGELLSKVKSLSASLTAAEQRNAELVELRKERDRAEKLKAELESAVCCMLDDSSENAQTGEITITRLDYETLAALIGEPTESGASDADRKADDEALQRRHDQERQEYFNEESGASE